MLKSYDELVKVDVAPYCEEREGFLYLNWARCIDLLRKNGVKRSTLNYVRMRKRAAVYFVVIRNFMTRTRILISVMKQESKFI